MGMQYELAEYGIDVFGCSPAGVETKSSLYNSLKGKSILISPDEFAKSCFRKCNSGVHHGNWKHEIIGLVID